MLDTFLGYINSRFITNGIHVLFLSDETQIPLCNNNSKNKTHYWQFKEKYIRFTVNFENDINLLCSEIIEKKYNTKPIASLIANNKDIIRKINYKMNETNLRTWMYSFDCYNTIIETVSEESINDGLLFFNVFILSILEKNNHKNEKEIDDFLKTHNIRNNHSSFEPLLIPYPKMDYTDGYFFFGTNLMDFIFTGKLAKDSLKAEIKLNFGIEDNYLIAFHKINSNNYEISYQDYERYIKTVYEGIKNDKYNPSIYRNILYRLNNPYIKKMLNIDESFFDKIINDLIIYARNYDVLSWQGDIEFIKNQMNIGNPDIIKGQQDSVYYHNWDNVLVNNLYELSIEMINDNSKKSFKNAMGNISEEQYAKWVKQISDFFKFMEDLSNVDNFKSILSLDNLGINNLITLFYSYFNNKKEISINEKCILSKILDKIEKALPNIKYVNPIHEMVVDNFRYYINKYEKMPTTNQ